MTQERITPNQHDVWPEIEALLHRFADMGIAQAVDYEKYYLYSLIAHSTAIEGSTLTELEAQILFDEGVTTGGKPLIDHLMNDDLRMAYEQAQTEAVRRTAITPTFLRMLNGILMRRTGSVHHVAAGTFDSSRGDYRLCSVTAGVGGRSYMNYQKVPVRIEALCERLQEQMKMTGVNTLRAQYELSFTAHLELATIHPWVDGNGRTARLLMHYIQFYYGLFPVKILREDRGAYIASLRQSQEVENVDCTPFLTFMTDRLRASLKSEIERAAASAEAGKLVGNTQGRMHIPQ